MNKLKIKDIHDDRVVKEFDRLTIEDLKKLLRHKDEFIHTGCPACHAMNISFQFTYQGMSYHRCNECELLYISPAPSESMHLDYVINSSAMNYWREKTPITMKKSRKPMYRERVEYVEDWCNSQGLNPTTSLELGAGNGEFAEYLASSSLDISKIILLEPQELSIDNPKIKIIKGGFEELEASGDTYEIIFAWELIEHILEPDNFLGLVRKALKPGAPFVFSTPNEKSLETRILGTASSNILFDHVRLYNPQAISKLLSRNGFRIVSITTPGKLDVEKLENYMKKKASISPNDSALDFILSNTSEYGENFQRYLCDNKLSSHMRVIAVADGEYLGCKSPVITGLGEVKNNSDRTIDKGDQFEVVTNVNAPASFNKIILPHVEDVADTYPKK